MLSKAVVHLRAQWMGALSLFLVIAGGTAYAANTIGSADVINESLRTQDLRNDNVTGDDVLESSLRQGTTWRLVGAAGQPAFGDHPNCRWENYDGVHSSAAFTRDAAGFVHLKGTLDPTDTDVTFNCESGTELNRSVFVLPPGYRPQRREGMPVVGANPNLSVYIDGPKLTDAPAGSVSIDGDIAFLDYVTIDGISFRCAPAGVNGCP
jgi:hypothetical protein